jgi:cardiolipin synthase C
MGTGGQVAMGEGRGVAGLPRGRSLHIRTTVLRRVQGFACALAMLAVAGCATLPASKSDAAARIAATARSTVVCGQGAGCVAGDSPLLQLARLEAQGVGEGRSAHHVLLLADPQDALQARLALIRGARSTLDLQTYIHAEDDAGWMFLRELIAAAGRGVRVRLLVDQISAMERVETLAALAAAHANLELRVYNPTRGRGRPNLLHYALDVACCMRRVGQRMHSKVMMADGVLAIAGGRNIADEYFDWSEDYNFEDKDVLVAGGQVAAMEEGFEMIWSDPRSVPAERLVDVARHLLRKGAPAVPEPRYRQPGRVSAALGGVAASETRLVASAIPVERVRFVTDTPDKHHAPRRSETSSPTTAAWREAAAGAREELILQTPYLVMSDEVSEWLLSLRDRPFKPQVVISTNSLASSDVFLVYSLTHKHKRRLSLVFGFHVYEYKPFAAVGARNAHGHAIRRGLHGKSLVADGRLSMVGSHNFDPRSERYNLESWVLVDDPGFAAVLERSIRRDIDPGNSWVIGPRDPAPVLSSAAAWIGKKTEYMPVFDLWPIRNATRYDFVPSTGCPAPPAPTDPLFRTCHVPVGDFDEVSPGLKLLTRLITAFGGLLVPML